MAGQGSRGGPDAAFAKPRQRGGKEPSVREGGAFPPGTPTKKIENLVKIGITPRHAIRAATSEAALLMGGTIELAPWKRASLRIWSRSQGVPPPTLLSSNACNSS